MTTARASSTALRATARPLSPPALALLALVALLPARPAAAARSCLLSQVTTTASGFNSVPALSADGAWVAFSSRADLTGGNPSGLRQVFLHEIATSTLTQVTSIATSGKSADAPALDADGNRLVFHSNDDLTGGNADGSFEIFVYDRGAAMLVQVTSAPSGYYAYPSISDDGETVAYAGSAVPSGVNSDGNDEVSTTTLSPSSPPAVLIATRITDSPLLSQDPSLSRDGSIVLFDSEGNLTGGNADGSFELFLHDRAGPSTTQITSSTFDSGNGSMGTGFTLIANNGRHLSEDNDLLVLHSFGDFTGENPSNLDRVFSYRRSTAAFDQLDGGTTPTLDASGRRAAFQGTTLGPVVEIAIGDLLDEIVTRVTTSTDVPESPSFQPSISADGTLVAFRSEADLLGTNPENNSEVFLARCWLFADSFESAGVCGWSAATGAPACP